MQRDAVIEAHAAREAKFIERAREDFLAFVLYTFGADYRVHWHHRILARVLEAWAKRELTPEGKPGRLLVHMPPRHGKTEQASKRLPAWLLGRQPTADLIGTSRDREYARRISRNTKRILNTPEYQAVFPKTKIPKKRVASDEREAYRNTAREWQIVDHGGSYKAYGAGQGIAGVGGDYLIVEDPYPTRDKAESQAYRQEINTWYDDDLYERREPGASIMIIHTRWHQNDLSGYLQRQSEEVEEADDWVVVNLQGIRTGDSQVLNATGDLDAEEIAERLDFDLTDPRDTGEALWPWKRSRDEFIAVRKISERKFSSLIQQKPSPEGGAIVERSWLESARYSSIPGRKGEWVWAIDPKHGSKEPESSEAVIQLWLNPEAEPANAYLVDEVHGIWSEPETEDRMLELADDPLWARAGAKLIEAEGDGRALKANLGNEIPGLQLVGPQRSLPGPEGSKGDRLRAVSRYYRAGNVRVPERGRMSDVEGFIAQHADFPGGNRDDRVDAAVYAVDHLLREEPDEDDGDYWDSIASARRSL